MTTINSGEFVGNQIDRVVNVYTTAYSYDADCLVQVSSYDGKQDVRK
jgi:hypothetical protein